MKKFDGAKRLFKYFKPEKARFALIFVFEIISVVADLFVPMVLGEMTNYITENFGAGFMFSGIAKLAAIALALLAAASVTSFAANFTSAHISRNLVFRLRAEIKAKLDRLPLAFYDKNSKGDVLSRVNNDTDTIANTIQESMNQIIRAVISIVAVLCFMFAQNVILTLIILATVPVFFVISRFFMKRSKKLFVRQQAELGLLNGHIEEMFSAHKEVKLFGLEAQSEEKFGIINKKLERAAGDAQGVSGMLMPAMNFVGHVSFIALVAVGALLVGDGTPFAKIKLGTVVEFSQYRGKFNQPINNVSNMANVIQSALAAAERVFKILDEPEEAPETIPSADMGGVKPEVAFKNVYFSYTPDKPLIENLSFGVEAGGNIAIVGQTGAGKTTLVNLLMRFYETDAGAITIDGRDIKEYNKHDLRSLFGMVLQDTWLFSGTVAENIAYGAEGANLDDVIAAAKAAHAHEFISALPHGYDTLINEDAGNISLGQKQLLTIARAVLKNPKILLLDEATSSVDIRTEAHIQDALKNLQVGKTSFTIAHRLSTVQNASLILVLDAGRVVEHGTHDELLKKDGFYAEIYKSQFAVS